MTDKNKVIIIAGPTASGKTDVSIMLADALNGEVISADSMQIYRHMDIGTAKIKSNDMMGIKHYMIDIVDPDYNYSVAEYQKECKSIIESIIKRNKIPIIVGGTGLYIHSLIKDIDFTQTAKDDDFRNKMNELSSEELYSMLKVKDPVSATRININDKKRLIRRLEIINHEDYVNDYDFLKDNSLYDYINIFLNPDREKLYKRIEERVDRMFEEGLVEEVKSLKEKYPDNCTSLQAIGYKEVISFLNDNESNTLDDIKDLIKKNTRHYAKRQITWFRRYDDFKWFNTDSYEKSDMLFDDLYGYIKRRISL